MPDLTVQIKSDLTNYVAGMKQAATTSVDASSNISGALNAVTSNIQKLETELSLYKDKAAASFDPSAIGGYNNSIQNIETTLIRLRHEQEDLLTPIREMGTVAKTAASQVSSSLAQAATSTANLGGSAMSATMRMQTMRSGMSAARDGVIGLTMSGQRADSALMAMGHHFTSLVGETGSLKGAFTALGSSLMGTGGIILAITLAAELWKKYEESQKKAAETQDDFTKSLNEGIKSSSDELAHVMILYQATQNENLSRGERLTAVKELQKEYPNYFKGLTQEAILAGKAEGAYNRLTQSIINSAVVKAGQDSLSAQLKPLIELTASLQAEQFKLDEADKKRQMANPNKVFQKSVVQSSFIIDNSATASDESKGQIQTLDNYRKQIEDKIKANGSAVQSLLERYGVATLLKNQEIKEPKGQKETQAEKDRKAALKIQAEYDNKQLEASQIGEARELQVLQDKYNKDLAIEQKGGADTTSLTKYFTDAKLAVQQKYATQRAEIEQQINDEINGIGEVNRAKELSNNKKWYDEKLKQIKDFGTKYTSEKAIIDAALLAKNTATNLKFDTKDTSESTKASGTSFDNKLKKFNNDSKPNNILGFDAKKANADLLIDLKEQEALILKSGKDVDKQLGDAYNAYTKKVKANNDIEEKQKNGIVIANELDSAFNNAFNSIISGSQNAGQAIVHALEQMIVKFIEAIAEALIFATILSVVSGGTLTVASALLGSTGTLSKFTGLSIPGHADGGITTRAHLAMVGEGREKEAIMPLSKLQSFINTNQGVGGQLSMKMQGSDMLVFLNRATVQKGRIG